MKTFLNFINEAKFSSKDFTFTITHHADKNGINISFIPDSKTLDSHSENEMVEFILKRINVIKVLNNTFIFRSDHQAAGIVFSLDVYQFTENIINEIK